MGHQDINGQFLPVRIFAKVHTPETKAIENQPYAIKDGKRVTPEEYYDDGGSIGKSKTETLCQKATSPLGLLLLWNILLSLIVLVSLA